MKQFKLKHILVIIACWFCVYSWAQKSTNIQTVNGKQYYVHKITKGQSLYAISKLYNVDVNAILAENDDIVDGIKTGQELRIPYINPLAVKNDITQIDTGRFINHRVAKGETLYAISKKYKITQQRLKELNPEIAGGLKEGQYLIIQEKKQALLLAKDTVITKPKKNSYTIGLFLPFKLAQIDAINNDALIKAEMEFPQMQSLAVDYYLGFKKAMDSLNTKEFELNLQLHDINENDSAKLIKICQSSEFKNLDMAVGPLHASGFKVLANYAKKGNLPCISPFTQQNKILFDNPYTNKTSSAQFTLIESLADFCIDSLKANSNIVIVNTGSKKDEQYIKTFKKRFNDRLSVKKDSILEVKGLTGVKATYVAGKRNVVILFTSNQVFLTDFITQLFVFSEKKDIVLGGFQSMTTVDNLDQEYLSKLQFHYPTNNYINYENPQIIELTKYYREFMNADPSEYYYQGYDAAMYYLNLLKDKGPISFIELEKYKTEGVATKFNFYKPDNKTGYENKGVYILKYLNYKVTRTNW